MGCNFCHPINLDNFTSDSDETLVNTLNEHIGDESIHLTEEDRNKLDGLSTDFTQYARNEQLDDFYTKEEIDNKEFVRKDEVNNYKFVNEEYLRNELSDYVKADTVESIIENATGGEVTINNITVDSNIAALSNGDGIQLNMTDDRISLVVTKKPMVAFSINKSKIPFGESSTVIVTVFTEDVRAVAPKLNVFDNTNHQIASIPMPQGSYSYSINRNAAVGDFTFEVTYTNPITNEIESCGNKTVSVCNYVDWLDFDLDNDQLYSQEDLAETIISNGADKLFKKSTVSFTHDGNHYCAFVCPESWNPKFVGQNGFAETWNVAFSWNYNGIAYKVYVSPEPGIHTTYKLI